MGNFSWYFTLEWDQVDDGPDKAGILKEYLKTHLNFGPKVSIEDDRVLLSSVQWQMSKVQT